MTNFSKFIRWLKITFLVLLVSTGLGVACGVAQVREHSAGATQAYDEELRARWAPSDPPDLPPKPSYVQGLDVNQLLAASEAQRKWEINVQRLRNEHAAQERQRRVEVEEEARSAVIRRGCPGCGTLAEEYSERAAIVALLPLAIAVWFLLLHMLGQAAGAVRGKD